MSTGFLWDERLMWHDTGPLAAHIRPGGYVEPDVSAEGPAAKRRIRNLLEVSGLLAQLVPLPARPATQAELLTVHTTDYLERLARMSEGLGGDAGESAPFTHGSFEIARLAAGGCIAAAEAVVAGAVNNAYALVRPPGHHAEGDRGRGFCLLANSAIAVHAVRARGIERVAIVDWDVHHGNGTQAAFWQEPSVLTVSIHQERNFPPDSGCIAERGGERAPEGNLNVPLPPGSGPGAYLKAIRGLVLPKLERFKPELLVLANGLDACALDPYGRMLLHSEDFRQMTSVICDAAERLCEGRLVVIHEGGYSTAYAPFCALAVIEELSGERTKVEDPFLEELDQMGGRCIQPHQSERLAAFARELG